MDKVLSVCAVKIDLTVVVLLASSPKSVVSASMKGEERKFKFRRGIEGTGEGGESDRRHMDSHFLHLIVPILRCQIPPQKKIHKNHPPHLRTV